MRKVSEIPISKIIDKKRKRVFIENDSECVWDEDEKKEIEEDMGMTFEKAFPLFIGDATERSEEVLKAIQECDDIFVETSYVGDSADLLNKMLEACVRLKIKGKRIFNFHYAKNMHMDSVNREWYWAVAKKNLFYFRYEYHPVKKFVLSNASKR